MAETNIPQTVDQYRARYEKDNPDIKNVSDDVIAEKVFGYLKEQGVANDYEAFIYNFIPNRPENTATGYRQKYEKDNPDIKKLTDIELANRIYDKRKLAGEKLNYGEFLDKFTPKQDDTTFINVPGGDFLQVATPTKRTTAEIAKAAGVDLASDVSTTPARFAGSLAINEAEQIQAYKNVMSNIFGQEVDVRQGPKTGELEFFNPQNKKYQLFNKPGLDTGDFASFGGDAMVIIPDIIVTTALASTPITGVAGVATAAGVSAATTYAMDMIRVGMGQELYGINLDAKGIQRFTESAPEGFISGAATGVGVSVPKLINLGKKLAKSGKVDPSDFEGAFKNAEEAKAVADSINKQLEAATIKKRLNFTLGQAADDPDLLAIQNAFESNPKYGFKGQFHSFGKDQAEALDAYFNLIRKGNYSARGLNGKDPIAADEVGIQIKKILDSRLDPQKKALIDAQKQAEVDLTDAVITLPSGSQKQAGVQIRSTIQEIQDDMDNVFSERYKTLFESGKGRYIETDVIRNTIKKLNERQQNTLFTKYPEIETFIKKPDQRMSLQTVKNTIEDLKRFDRDIRTGRVSETPVEGSVKNLLGSIDEQLTKSLGADDPWLLQYKNLSKDYSQAKKKLSGVIGKITEMKDGRLKIADADVFDETFKTGKGAEDRIEATFNIIKDKPESLDTFRGAIEKFYRDKVVNADGSINLANHEKFIKNYEYGLKRFFGEDNFGKVSEIGGLAKQLDKITKEKDQLIKDLSKTTEGRISRLDTDLIFDEVYNSAKPSSLRKVVGILRKDEETLNAFKSTVLNDLQLKVTNIDNLFDYKKFANYMKDNKQNLQTVFADDPKYIKNLEDFSKALKILDRTETGPIAGKFNNSLDDFIRARLGQFTFAGRVFTGAKKLVSNSINKQMGDIILNPAALDDLMKLKDVAPKNTAKRDVILSKVFQYGIQDVSPDQEFSPSMINIINKKGPTINLEKRSQTVPTQEIAEGPTSPVTNIFAANTPNTPITTGVAPTEQPTNNTMASMPNTGGITNIPQEQLNKYSTLFGPIV
jgi:hypothetical protein